MATTKKKQIKPTAKVAAVSTKKTEKPERMPVIKFLPYIFLIAGIVGLLSSLVLSVDTMKLLENPNYIPSCNINPILSCGSVMKTDQASAFGIPNPFIGIAAFAALATIGAAMLAGATFKRWFWLAIQAGATLGLAFVVWLIAQSVYVLGELCPFCIAVWIIILPTFWYTTLYNLKEGNLIKGAADNKAFQFAYRYHLDILAVAYLVITVLILVRFWYYFGTFV